MTLVDAVQVPTKPMTLEWAEGLTPRSELNIELEQHPPNYTDIMKSWYYRSALRIQYTGRFPLRKLKLQMDAFDESGSIVRTDDFIVTYSRYPAISPNQTRLHQRFLEAKAKPVDFKITVLEIE